MWHQILCPGGRAWRFRSQSTSASGQAVFRVPEQEPRGPPATNTCWPYQAQGPKRENGEQTEYEVGWRAISVGPMHRHSTNKWEQSLRWPKANYACFKDRGLPKGQQSYSGGVDGERRWGTLPSVLHLPPSLGASWGDTSIAFITFEVKAERHMYVPWAKHRIKAKPQRTSLHKIRTFLFAKTKQKKKEITLNYIRRGKYLQYWWS